MADIPPFKPASADKAPAGKTTPKSGRARTNTLPKDRAFKATIPEIRDSLESACGFLVLGFSARGDMVCADAVMEGAPDLIDSWVWMAEKHVEVRRALEVLCGSGGYLAVITSTLGVALPIMQHHGMYPAGAPTPRSLKNVMANMFTPDADQSDHTETSAD